MLVPFNVMCSVIPVHGVLNLSTMYYSSSLRTSPVQGVFFTLNLNR